MEGAHDHDDGHRHVEKMDDADEDRTCWICLAGEEAGHLIQPCACPRYTHSACLARWQLTSAGKSEETRCRFCDRVLPDWRPALTPAQLEPRPSVMSVRYRGVTHRIQYTPGPDGLDSFLKTLQAIGIKVASASQVTFLCRSPDTGEEMSLRGLTAFDAAAYCASITAAKRLARSNVGAAAGAARQRRSTSSSGAADDMGVHAAHPESPTAAGAAGGGGGAAAQQLCFGDGAAAAGPAGAVAATAGAPAAAPAAPAMGAGPAGRGGAGAHPHPHHGFWGHAASLFTLGARRHSVH